MRRTKEKRIGAIKRIWLGAALLGTAGVLVAIGRFFGDGFLGYSARIVVSSSMEKSPETDVSRYKIKDIPIRSLIIIRLAPTANEEREAFYKTLCEGDVLTFFVDLGGNITITHRVKKIEFNGFGYIITLSGDNQNAGTQVIDTAKDGSRIIGKVVFCSHAAGEVICTLREPSVFVFIMALSIIATFSSNLFCTNRPFLDKELLRRRKL